MSDKIIPTAILGDLSENIGIASMTVRYTQRPDGNDASESDQFLTVEAVNYDDGDEESVMEGNQGYYLVLSTERWAIDDPSEMALVLNDFFARLGTKPTFPLLKIECSQPPDEIVIPAIEHHIVETEDKDPDADIEQTKKAQTKAKPVDVLMDDGRVTFGSSGKAAKAIGVTTAWLSKSLQLGKTCNGYHVRYSNPELDASLAEIKERDKQPYEISRP